MIYTKPEISCLLQDYMIYNKVVYGNKNTTYLFYRTLKSFQKTTNLKCKWVQDLERYIGMTFEVNQYSDITKRINEVFGEILSVETFSDMALRYLVKNYVFFQFTSDLEIIPTNLVSLKYFINHQDITWVKYLLKILKIEDPKVEYDLLKSRLWEWWYNTELPKCSNNICTNKVSMKTFFKLNKYCKTCISKYYSNNKKNVKTDEFNPVLFVATGIYSQDLKNYIRDTLTYINKKGILVLKPRWKLYINDKKFQELLEETKFIDWDENTKTLSRKIYCVLHDLTKEPKCLYSKCPNVAAFKGLQHGYSKFCNANTGCNAKYEKEDCGKILPMNSRESILKREETKKKVFLEKYGVDNPMKIPEIKKKVAEKNKDNMRHFPKIDF